MRLIMLLLPVSLFAQVVLTPNLPASVNAGSAFQTTVTQTGSDNVSGYQFTIALPSGISLTACTSLVAGKSAACPPIPATGLTGTVNVLLVGVNQTVLTPGVPSLSLSLKAASPLPISSGTFSLIKTIATAPNAQTIASSGKSAAVAFTNSPPCTLVSSSKTSTGSFNISVVCK